jgi:hypothetical protein
MNERIYQRLAPTRLEDVQGQDKAIAAIRGWGAQFGFGGQLVVLTGRSGHGKSLIAGLLARELADEPNITSMDAGKLTAGWLDHFEATMYMRLLGFNGRDGRVLILEEAHGLRPDPMRRLLDMLEKLPGHCTVILTTTVDGQDTLFDKSTDAGPLWSRGLQIRLAHDGMAQPVAKWLSERFPAVLGINGKPPAWYLRKVQDANNNVRAAIQSIAMALATDGAGR